MSVESSSNPAAAAELARTSVQSPQHVLVFYGGYTPGDVHGGPLTAGVQTPQGWHVRSASRLYWGIKALCPGIQHFAFNSCLDNSTQNQAIQAGLSAIQATFNPSGRLIVCGFSAGGYNALNLCWRVLHDCAWYNIRTRSLRNGAVLGRDDIQVVIDLLITVDPCLQSIHITRAGPVPSIVRQHVNFYQQSDPEFQGTSIETATLNKPMPGSKHETICIDTLPDVQCAIRSVLDSPLFSPAQIGACAATPRR